ncbi:transposase [Clostridium beijerinckii]|uniref:Transposase n=1 Tax=Clostridium beijerinckii TaxID=1520 RepID=A0A7X9SLV1_CLOBE|nr:transposase [Clostridium beijerinckii]
MQTQLKLDPFEKALFVFENRQMNRIKIFHFDGGFWLYYFSLENNKLKWLLIGYEVRTKSKFKPI